SPDHDQPSPKPATSWQRCYTTLWDTIDSWPEGVLNPAEKSRAGDGLDASVGEIADFSCAARCYT
ncbi:MAG: hypothetical protein ACK5XZ_08880, partial [Hyphomonadaceae bacterium]